MHRVGFGDCFLLTLGYPAPLDDGRDERHLLIDFGTMSSAGVPSAETAAAISERTGGQLDVVVMSHRHRDHVSGFASAANAAALTATRPPSLVVRPWTEDPDADANFTGVDGGPGAESRAFLRELGTARAFADGLANEVTRRSASGLHRELRTVAMLQLANEAAVDQLHAWAGADAGEYLHYGKPSRIGKIVPGLTVHVLGPPTIEQHSEVATQRQDDPDEFWMLYRQLADQLPLQTLHLLGGRDAAARSAPSIATDAGGAIDPGPVRWITERLDRQELASSLRLVRLMDEVLNNTSLILVFELEGPAGQRRLLFPGDAQIENWEYALKIVDVAENRALLDRIDLYKVGHHGSRNATPRSLFELWGDPSPRAFPMASLLSTKHGVHGHHVETAVPRETLVAALDARTTLLSSDEIEAPWVEVGVDLNSADPFAETARAAPSG